MKISDKILKSLRLLFYLHVNKLEEKPKWVQKSFSHIKCFFFNINRMIHTSYEWDSTFGNNMNKYKKILICLNFLYEHPRPANKSHVNIVFQGFLFPYYWSGKPFLNFIFFSIIFHAKRFSTKFTFTHYLYLAFIYLI